jgi:Putative adhesin
MHHRLLVGLACPVAMSLAACSVNVNPSTETFSWKGPVATASWVRLRNANGDFTIREGDGDSASIQMEIKRSSQFAPAAQIKVLKTEDGIIACVVYGSDNSCSTSEYKAGQSSAKGLISLFSGRTTVTGTVTLPKGVKLDVNSINGNVDVNSRVSELLAETVNGNVNASGARGTMRISTVNGNVNLDIDSVGGAVSANTTNGNVDVKAPDTINAALSMRTVNGTLGFAFPNATSSGSKKNLSATLGRGGAPFDITTVNGNVTLKARLSK